MHAVVRHARLALVLLLASGCASHQYRPEPNPRIAIYGNCLYKNGRCYPRGEFYGGVEDAVRENPRSAEAARSAHQLRVAGVVVELGGLAQEGTGVVMFLDGHNRGTKTEETVGGALVVGSLIPLTISLVLLTNAGTRLEDAVNSYNDSVAPMTLREQPPGQPLTPAPLNSAPSTP